MSVLPPADVEEKLIARLVSRDERAFNELVRAYERRVISVVFRIVGNQAEAEDIAQDVFVQVFKAIGTFRGESKLSTWIYRIAINLSKNRLKYHRTRHAGDQQDLEDFAERVPLGELDHANTAQVPRPDETLAGQEVEAIVANAIAEVELTFRECLILRDVHEFSYEDIAEIVEVNVGTVKSRISRGRAQLRKLVESRLGEKVG